MQIKTEIDKRVAFIQNVLKEANASGVVLGLSGGKDSALVAILAKLACDNVVGLIMPCDSKRNYGIDKTDAEILAEQFNIKVEYVDITPMKDVFRSEYEKSFELSDLASMNINPRLRMITLYAYAQSHNMLVAGTGNACEAYMGYFTKWGDGAHDFNPIGDLTVTEIYELLEYFKAPRSIIEKAPSAALTEGQTDEDEMGVTYAQIEAYMKDGRAAVPEEVALKIEAAHAKTMHKRSMPKCFER